MDQWDWVGDFIAQRAQVVPEREAIIDLDSGEHFTYAELNERANRLANYLAEELNVQKGDRVAFVSRNRIELFDGLFACGKLGTIFVPYNVRLTSRELQKLIENEQPKVIFYEELFKPLIWEFKTDLVIAMSYIVLDNEIQPQAGEIDAKHAEKKQEEMRQEEIRKEEIRYSEITRYANNGPRRCEGLDLADIYLLIHTGGTTGLPKGAMISHRSVLYNQLNNILDWGINWNKTFHLLLPLFHTGGWNLLTLAILRTGGRLLINRAFDPKLTLQVINQYSPNYVFGAATIFRMMVDQPEFEATDWSSVEWVMSGAAPTPVQLMKKFWEKGVKMCIGYGLTEGGPTNICAPVNFMNMDELKEKYSSVGKPFSFTMTKLISDNGNDVEGEDVGELIFSGPQIFSGYWNNEQETRKTLRDGWVYTGDMARRDKDGFYYIVGRKKNMFISGGENVFPPEIENVLYQIPEVHECCVIGVPDEKWGEVGKAIISTKPGRMLAKEQVIAYLKTQLAGYKVPKYVIFVEQVPKNSVGKIVAQEAIRLYGEPGDV